MGPLLAPAAFEHVRLSNTDVSWPIGRTRPPLADSALATEKPTAGMPPSTPRMAPQLVSISATAVVKSFGVFHVSSICSAGPGSPLLDCVTLIVTSAGLLL